MIFYVEWQESLRIEELLARTLAAITGVQAKLPPDFLPRVADVILGGLEQAAKALGAMVP